MDSTRSRHHGLGNVTWHAMPGIDGVWDRRLRSHHSQAGHDGGVTLELDFRILAVGYGKSRVYEGQRSPKSSFKSRLEGPQQSDQT